MKNPINSYIKYLIEKCYEEDYNPYYAEDWRENYCYHYTFIEWYFLYRKYKLQKYYTHTPIKLIIGSDIYN